MKKGSAATKVAAILIAISLLIWFNQSYLQLTPTDIPWILSFGWLAPLIYVILYTVRPLILFPASVFSLAGGLAFGAIWGTVLTVIGAAAGAILSFVIARYMGKSLIR